MKLVIGSDHGGIELKQEIYALLKARNYDIEDLGTHTEASVDYPDYAHKVCKQIQDKQATLGILICGTGIGISIAANKHKGIRASLCHNEYEAEMTRRHNDSNILVLGGRVVGKDLAFSIVHVT